LLKQLYFKPLLIIFMEKISNNKKVCFFQGITHASAHAQDLKSFQSQMPYDWARADLVAFPYLSRPGDWLTDPSASLT
jgi:hypothetical protein